MVNFKEIRSFCQRTTDINIAKETTAKATANANHSIAITDSSNPGTLATEAKYTHAGLTKAKHAVPGVALTKHASGLVTHALHSDPAEIRSLRTSSVVHHA